MPDETYSLDGETAREVYDREVGTRTAVVDLARKMAELTIPSVFPPEGYQTGDDIEGNNQSVGSRCVNNLASRLMFMAFPPSRPMLKYEVVEHLLKDEIAQNPQMWSKIRLALARKELEHRRRASTTSLASAYTGFLKQMLVAGNCLWQHVDLDHPVYHRLDSYVVIRDGKGIPLVTILKETVKVQSLDDDVQSLILASDENVRKTKEWERVADIYTVLKLDVEGTTKVWRYWQEYDGELIPDTELTTDWDDPPMYPHWLIPVYGQNYGRSYCEEYRGDLFTVENGASSLNDGAAVAAWTLLFVRPGSPTNLKQVMEAENLSVLPGRAEDVSAFQLGKGSDFSIVERNTEKAERRLSFAFLLNSAIQRSGERVTAEEWKRMGAELDQAMGGLYTELAQGPQRRIIVRFVTLHEDEDRKLPQLPKGLVRIAPITGMDALGSTTEEEALVTWSNEIIAAYGNQVLGAITHPLDYARRLAAEKGIQPEGLLKDEKDLEADKVEQQRQAAQQTLLDKGTAPGIKALASQLPAMGQQPTQQGMTSNG